MSVDPYAVAIEVAGAKDKTVAVVPTPPGAPAPLWLCVLDEVAGIPVTGARAIATAAEYPDLDLGGLLERLAVRAAVAGHRDAWARLAP